MKIMLDFLKKYDIVYLFVKNGEKKVKKDVDFAGILV